jgi:hypothetical protein
LYRVVFGITAKEGRPASVELISLQSMLAGKNDRRGETCRFVDRIRLSDRRAGLLCDRMACHTTPSTTANSIEKGIRSIVRSCVPAPAIESYEDNVAPYE